MKYRGNFFEKKTQSLNKKQDNHKPNDQNGNQFLDQSFEEEKEEDDDKSLDQSFEEEKEEDDDKSLDQNNQNPQELKKTPVQKTPQLGGGKGGPTKTPHPIPKDGKKEDDDKDVESKKISVEIAELKGKPDDEVTEFVNNWIGKIMQFMTENGVQVDSKASEVRFNVNNKEYLHGKYGAKNAGVAKKDDKKKQPFTIEYKASGEIIITVNDDKAFDALTKYLDSEKLKYKVVDQEKDGKKPEGVKDNAKPEEAKKGGFGDMLKKQREEVTKDKQRT
ncbi:hypothetical protein [Candidatus Deianiraea vastatrix]|uniref:Uncharacterized protein n=1 Tax=Candidatus Deianiraea vastatrix TaxID=2163644 RepID=A0A5B8XHB8_9RICK|nr:hypothetical protein [Candidatus Deianiraea vastatrix]QED23554.1 hypothetical protein Deia_00765 [Candidatus Deianiraea vastatrix]